MKRKGISFTLTLVVLGVVLLMTAFSLVLLGNSSIGDTIKQATSSGEDASVQQACGDLARSIDNVYCDRWVQEGASGPSACSDAVKNRDSNHPVRAREESCNWKDVANSNEQTEAASLLRDRLEQDQSGNYQPIVTVNGDRYNCIAQGYMTATCPANQ